MLKISGIIITFNEERNIGACLDSIKDLVDEILVVDSFSSDNTEKICLSYNTRFIKNKFEGHIQQKNFALGLATHTMILSLDADEVLSDELRKSILEIKKNNLAGNYTMNRLTNYCGKWIRHSGWYPDTKLRFFQKDSGTWGGINPHDEYMLSKGSQVSKLKGDILHYSYYSISQHIHQVDKFTDIAAKELYARNKKVSIFSLFFRPIIRFKRDYFLRMGFLDGFYGLVICVISSYANFLKYAKLKRLNSNPKLISEKI